MIVNSPKLSYKSAHCYSWQAWLISMHCSQKTFHFLSVSNGPTSILSDIVITLQESHKTIFAGYFWKLQVIARDAFETSQRCHKIDIFFEVCSRRFRDVTQKTSFLRYVRDVLKTSQKRHLFWDVFATS